MTNYKALRIVFEKLVNVNYLIKCYHTYKKPLKHYNSHVCEERKLTEDEYKNIIAQYE